jgi:hypothetical protein
MEQDSDLHIRIDLLTKRALEIEAASRRIGLSDYVRGVLQREVDIAARETPRLNQEAVESARPAPESREGREIDRLAAGYRRRWSTATPRDGEVHRWVRACSEGGYPGIRGIDPRLVARWIQAAADGTIEGA